MSDDLDRRVRASLTGLPLPDAPATLRDAIDRLDDEPVPPSRRSLALPVGRSTGAVLAAAFLLFALIAVAGPLRTAQPPPAMSQPSTSTSGPRSHSRLQPLCRRPRRGRRAHPRPVLGQRRSPRGRMSVGRRDRSAARLGGHRITGSGSPAMAGRPGATRRRRAGSRPSPPSSGSTSWTPRTAGWRSTRRSPVRATLLRPRRHLAHGRRRATWAKTQLPRARFAVFGEIMPAVQFDSLDATRGFAFQSGERARRGRTTAISSGRPTAGRPGRPTARPATAAGHRGLIGFATPMDGVIVNTLHGAGLVVTHDGGRTWADAAWPTSPAARRAGSSPSASRPSSAGAPGWSRSASSPTELSVARVFDTTDAGSSWYAAATLPAGAGAIWFLDPQRWIA